MSQKRSAKLLKRKAKSLKKQKKKQNEIINTQPLRQLTAKAFNIHQTGDFETAETLYRQILQQAPHNSHVLHLLGVLCAQTGQGETALALFEQAISYDDTVPYYYDSLGNILAEQGRLDEAISHYQHALALDPHQAITLNNLGNALLEQGKLVEALSYYRQAITLDPDFAEAYNNIGHVLLEQNQPIEAKEVFEKALALEPTLADAHNGLGNVFSEQGQLDKAITAYQLALELTPDHVKVYDNLGLTLAEQGRLAEAIAAFKKAFGLAPDYSNVHYHLLTALREQGEYQEATWYARQILAAYPDNLVNYLMLGNLLLEQNLPGEAKQQLQQGLAILPQTSILHVYLAQACFEQGLVEDAIAYYQQALAIEPDVSAHSELLFTLNHSLRYQPAALFAEHKQFNQHFTAFSPAQRSSITSERLKIGYITPDFSDIACFIIPILKHHDQTHFEIFCYQRADAPLLQAEQAQITWISYATLTDEAFQARIETDQIDILIDLAGHTPGNRLQVFAQKPVPIQATYLGYPNTTGLEAMDYRITDDYLDPEEVGEAFNTEALVRMPTSCFCYQPQNEPMDTSPDTGPIVFGSLNALAQLSPPLLAQWAEILKAVPDAELLINDENLNDAVVRQALIAQFTQLGISPERLRLNHVERSLVYQQITIGLDSYPYQGLMTTCDMLWQGIPVVTQIGDRPAARLGFSLLSAVGLTTCIANTADEYVQIACRLANDRSYLQQLRSTLSTQMRASALCDGAALTHHLETAYQAMWAATEQA